MDDDDHRPAGEPDAPDPQPPTDPATQAFAHLAARVAGMEERLDGRMAMMTRALEHIAIEKQSIDMPDYSPTLAKMGGHLADVAVQTKVIADAPALQLTPESMAQRIAQAAERAREADRITIKKAREALDEGHRDLMRTVGTVRTKEEQRWHLGYAVGGAILALSLLWLIYPGWAASVGPRSWLWPERTARRVLGEPTQWDAGIRLMRAGDPQAWEAIVNAADMTHQNRDALAACQKASIKAKRPVRCTIWLGKPQS